MPAQILEALRTGLGFLTTIPVGFTAPRLDELAKHMYVYPIIGAFIGLSVGVIGWAVSLVPGSNPFLQASLVIVAVYSITGFIHLDGLIDMGDGLLKQGTMEERRKVIKEPHIGVGGIAFCIIAFLLLWSTIVSIRASLVVVLITAEVAGKLSMVEIASFGKASHRGLGSLFAEKSSSRTFLVALVVAIVISVLCLGWKGVAALVSSIVITAGLLKSANNAFGGISGDVIGASNELGRVAALLAVSFM